MLMIASSCNLTLSIGDAPGGHVLLEVLESVSGGNGIPSPRIGGPPICPREAAASGSTWRQAPGGFELVERRLLHARP